MEFAIDKDAPKVTGVKDGLFYNEAVTPVVTDKNLNTVTLNGADYVSGTEITADGEYTLIAKDYAGKTTKVKFTIDTTKSEISIAGKKNAWTNTQSFDVTITEKNLDKVYYAWTGTYKNTNTEENSEQK